MNLKQLTKSRSVLWVWAISYIAVLFIPLITVFINYNLNVKTIRQGIVEAYELILDNTGEQIDRYLEMQQECYTFAITGECFDSLRLYSEVNNAFYHQGLEMQLRLENYLKGTQSDLHCMLYMQDLDYVLSDTLAYEASIYGRALEYFHNVVTKEEWFEIAGEQYANKHFVSKSLTSREGDMLYFANTLNHTAYHGTTVFVGVPLIKLAELTANLEQGVTLLLSIEGESAAAFRDGKIVDDIALLQEEFSEIDSKKWLALSLESGAGKITYDMLIPTTMLDQKLNKTENFFVFNVGLTLLFGVLGTIYLLWQNYQPVLELLDETGKSIKCGNEFREISKAVHELKQENSATRKKVDSQKKALIGSWLLSMMKGRTTSLQNKEMNSFFEMDFKGPVGMVGFVIPALDRTNIQYDELNFFVVSNIFEELMEKYPCHKAEDGRFLLYVFDLKDADEEVWHQYTLEQIERLCTIMEEKREVSLIGVVSDTENDLEDIKFLYRKIMEVFEYQSVVGGFGAFSVRMLESQDEDIRLMEYVRAELGDALKAGSLEEAQAVANKFFFGQQEIPFATLKMYVFDAYNIVADIFREYETDPVSRMDILRYVELLTQARERESLRHAFTKVLEIVCDRITVKWQLDSWNVVDCVKEYVLQHYEDQNLNISVIGQDIHRNPKYISRVFKEETGEGILDYINRYRITKAKELMASRKYTFEEIANRVGYPEGRTLRRAFVKITGTTPSKYVLDGQ